MITFLDMPDTNLQYRLADGNRTNQGRVEVQYGSIWGTVCDDDFDNAAAKVVCDHLGIT